MFARAPLSVPAARIPAPGPRVKQAIRETGRRARVGERLGTRLVIECCDDPARELDGKVVIGRPGQFRADDVTPAADVYSLGVILYQILSGRTPFEGSNSAVSLKHKTADRPRVVGGGRMVRHGRRAPVLRDACRGRR